MNPYNLLDAVDISNQIPSSFFTQMESKKWSERKEALETIEKVTNVPKIKNADFNELVRVLKKTVAKDANIVVVQSAAKCICQLAQALRYDFAPYSNSCLPVIFEKFKEKKPHVITVLRDAADAAFIGTNLESIFEDVIQLLDNKNPQIKSEMCLFLARTFSKYPTQVMNKKTLRPLVNALIKTLSDMDATVRDNSALAIGTAMKVSGEKLMMTLIADVEPIKLPKIKEFCEKAEIFDANENGQCDATSQHSSNQENQVVTQTNGNAGGQDNSEDDDEEERVYEMLEAVDIYNQITSSFYTQMESKKWSERKEALETIEKITAVPRIRNADFSELVRVLKKTVAKDANIVVVQSAAKCIHQLARGLRYDFAPHSNSCLSTIFEKFKEKKPHVIVVLRDAADAAFIGTNLENIFEDVIALLDNKNPQIKSEMCLFLARIFAKYPAQVLNKKTLRPLVNALIKTLSDMDATVRDNSALAIGTAMKVSGEKLMMTLIADVEPIKLPKIKEFCEKAQVKKIPKAALSTMNNNTAPPAAPQSNHAPPKNSSATMVRSTSNRRLTVAGSKPTTQRPASGQPAPSSNATVKRNATIIKRTTAPRRSVAPASSQQNLQQQQQQQQQPQAQPQQSIPPPVTTNMAPPAVPQLTNNNTSARNNLLNCSSSLMGMVSTPAKPVFTTMLHGPSKFQKHGILDSLIFKLISDSTSEVLNALTELEEIVADDTDSEFKTRVNQLIDLNSLQLVKSFDCLRSSQTVDETAAERIQKISNLIKKVFSRQQLISAASQQSIRFLLLQLFTLTQACGNINDDGTVRKTLNNLAVAVMDSFEPATIMCILTGLLNEPTPLSIVEPVKDAIIRSMRSFK